jgi:hypothetical protein
MPIQVQSFFTIQERFVIVEPYLFPNQAFRLSTTLSTLSQNRYIHTCFPALDCPVHRGIPFGVSGASRTWNHSPSPTCAPLMTGTLADTSEKHHGNAYTICVTICLETQQVTACADFCIPHTQPVEHEYFYWRFQGYIAGRGRPPVPSNDGPGFCNAGKWFVRAGRAVPGVLGLGCVPQCAVWDRVAG